MLRNCFDFDPQRRANADEALKGIVYSEDTLRMLILMIHA